MSHSIDIRNQFIQLRADGQSFGQISEQLGVAKSTLHAWEEEYDAQIVRLRRLAWEEQEAHWQARIEDQLTDLLCYMKDCQHRINDFKLDQYSLRDAFAILRESRREYFRLRAILMGTSKGPLLTPPKSNKTERSDEANPTTSRNINELQQPQSLSFDSATPELRAEPRRRIESDSKGQTSCPPCENPKPQPADAVHVGHQVSPRSTFTPAAPVSQPSTNSARPEGPQPDDAFLGSVVINPLESPGGLYKNASKPNAPATCNQPRSILCIVLPVARWRRSG